MGPPQTTAAPAEWIPSRAVRVRFGVQAERLLWLVVTGKVRCRITPARKWPEYHAADIERALITLPKIGNYRDRRRAPPMPPGPSEMNEAERLTLAGKQTSGTRSQAETRTTPG